MNNLPEKILSITEVNDLKEDTKSWSGMDGYKVVTDKQEIFVLISNDQSCCEDWGYFDTNNDTEDFVGSNLLDLKLVDDCLNVKKMEDLDMDAGDIIFVNFETDKGTFQLAVYNSHNGYYGHDIEIKSNQLNENFSI